MKTRNLLSKINKSWSTQPVFWALTLIVTTALVNRALLNIPSQKDEMFIELAKRLTGQTDENTVAAIKEQAIAYLTMKLQTEYVTREDLLNAKMSLSELFSADVSKLSAKVDSITKLQDPDARYRQLLVEIGNANEGGRVIVASETGWQTMCKMYEIIKDDRTFRAPHVAEAVLQMALRQCYPNDDLKQARLKEITLFALEYYETATGRKGRLLSVYKAMTLLLHDTPKFSGFVRKEKANNPSFEKELRDSHFLNQSFFSSHFWPKD